MGAQPRGLALDLTRHRAYVSSDRVAVDIVSNLDTAPVMTGTLSGSNTLLVGDCDGVAYDPDSDELYVSNSNGTNRVCIFSQASALSGALDIAPARVLEGTAPLFGGPGGMVVGF